MIIRHYYEKSIFYYENALKEENNNMLIKCKIYSLLAEAYINYKYYNKGLKNINKCFNIINSSILENKETFDNSFIITSFFRKIRCNVGLRKYKEYCPISQAMLSYLNSASGSTLSPSA